MTENKKENAILGVFAGYIDNIKKEGAYAYADLKIMDEYGPTIKIRSKEIPEVKKDDIVQVFCEIKNKGKNYTFDVVEIEVNPEFLNIKNVVRYTGFIENKPMQVDSDYYSLSISDKKNYLNLIIPDNKRYNEKIEIGNKITISGGLYYSDRSKDYFVFPDDMTLESRTLEQKIDKINKIERKNIKNMSI